MGVGEYSLVSLADAKSAIGSVPRADGIWIYCSASGATAATVQVTDTTIVLVITGGSSAGTNTISLTAAATDTIAELITAINALTGWTAGAIYNGSASSTDLVVTGALSCVGAANELTLKIEDNYRIEKLVDRASDFIERSFGRKFKTRTYDRQVYDGRPGNRLILDQYPVTQIGRVSIDRINAFSVTNTTATNFALVEVTTSKVRLNADGTATELTISSSSTINDLIAAINAVSGWSAELVNSDVASRKASYTSLDGTTKVSELIPMTAINCLSPRVAYAEVPSIDLTDAVLEVSGDEDRNLGILYSPSGWSFGKDSVRVDMIAGYTTIPPALEDLCLALVKGKWDQSKRDAGLQSESIGGVYSYSTRDLKAVSTDVLEAASFFRRLVL